jgi:hypothetical protein
MLTYEPHTLLAGFPNQLDNIIFLCTEIEGKTVD